MTFEQYWSALLKHWRLIVICFLVVGAGAYVGSKLMTHVYQSSALVQVMIRSSNNSADYNSLLASDQLVQTEATLATSDPVLREVASHYRGLTVEQLAKEATATPRLNTQLFEIDVQDASPTRAAALANDIAVTLSKQQFQLFQQNAAQSEDFLLLAQPAQPVLTPVRPNVLLNTGAGLLTGLFLGMLLAMLFELLDTRVRTPEALSQLLGWPVLATIWLANPAKNEKEVVIHPKGRDINGETYRILRTNIGFSAIDTPLRSIVVTSALPLEGKTTIAANLAIVMAKAGKTTLLIDANLRHPGLQQIFGLSADKMGLSNAILACSTPATAHVSPQHPSLTPATPEAPASTPAVSSPSLDPFIHTVDIPNLCIMPSGPPPPNPSELLDSKAMQRLLTALSDYEAEVVIFDTPALLGLSDASILASKVDGTLIVVDGTRATTKFLKQVQELLGQAGAHVLGCVVNKQRRSRNSTIYSYDDGTDVQINEGTHINGRIDSLPVLPVTPDVLNKPDLLERSDEENGSMNNVNPPALTDDFDATDQTIKVPRIKKSDEENGSMNNGTPPALTDDFDATDQTIEVPRIKRRRGRQGETES
ncbi:MAG: Wzz/FepE/Etk N-terminal domain-containing protein [Ktedonobacteraceae bacterium]